MATNGPLIGLPVEGQGPGDDNALPAGTHTLNDRGRLHSLTGIDKLEVVMNGKVVETVALTGDATSADFAKQIVVDRSGWIVLRAWNDHATPDVFDLYPYATTTPVFVSIGGEPIRSREDATKNIKWIDKVRVAAAANRDYNSSVERDAVLKHIDTARKVFEQRL